MLLSVLYIIGITAEAMTGALSAGKQKMDWFGVMLVASAKLFLHKQILIPYLSR